uniref:hypothetical protein n=1 Tax=Citrobacter freundii TaxID=546 RepID=UPI001953BEB9
IDSRTVERGGTTYQQNVSRIGRRAPDTPARVSPAPPPSPPVPAEEPAGNVISLGDRLKPVISEREAGWLIRLTDRAETL